MTYAQAAAYFDSMIAKWEVLKTRKVALEWEAIHSNNTFVCFRVLTEEEELDRRVDSYRRRLEWLIHLFPELDEL